MEQNGNPGLASANRPFRNRTLVRCQMEGCEYNRLSSLLVAPRSKRAGKNMEEER